MTVGDGVTAYNKSGVGFITSYFEKWWVLEVLPHVTTIYN